MPHGLQRFQRSAQSHFVTFTCYHRRRGFDSPAVYDLFAQVLERMPCRFSLSIYGYVVVPEHVHLLVSEPPRGLLADAMHYLSCPSPNAWGLAHFGRSATMTARSASFARSCVIFIAIQ